MTNLKKLLAVVMSVVLLLSAVPMVAFAADTEIATPEFDTEYPTVIYERKGIYWDNFAVTGNSAIANGPTQYVCFNADSSAIDTTEAEYLEFDVYSSVAIKNTLNLWVSVNVWEESGRARFDFPALNAGWNHVVINLAEVKNLAEWANKYDRSIILSMHVRGTPVTETNDAITMLFANAAFTVEAPTPEMNNTHAFSALEREGIFWEWYQESGVITDWSDYTCFTEDKSAHDLSDADYLEMDVYTKTAFPGANLWLSVTTGDEGGRALFTFPKLEVGWNHVIIDINDQKNMANFNGYTYTKSALKSMRLGDNLSFECNYLLKFANLAFTTDTVLAPDASYENILVKEYPEIKNVNEYMGGNLLFSASRFADGLDLNKADVVEFDFYVSTDAVNDLDVTFTDSNGATATATVSADLLKAGWNHIALPDDEIAFSESYEKKLTISVRFSGTLLEDEDTVLTVSYANFAITAIETEKQEMVYVGKKISVYAGYDNIEIPASENIANVTEPIVLPVPLNIEDIDYIEFNLFVKSKCDITVNLNATPIYEGEIYEEANAYYTISDLNYGWTQVCVPVSELIANEWFDPEAINYIYFSGIPSSENNTVLTVEDFAFTSESLEYDINEGDYNADGEVDMLDLIHTVNYVLSEENVWFANVAEVETAANGVIDAVDIASVKKLLFTMF